MKDEYDFSNARLMTTAERERILELFAASNQCRAFHVVDEHDEIENDYDPVSYFCTKDNGHEGRHLDHEGREFDAGPA